ncbi:MULTISPECIES: DUF2017 domain-containing protein [Rothia]|uniref:Uncharacterized protein n=1 Tax=Rothia nasimurium TaxID=85336 RepID=A0A1Y1RS97_9MICC|nr:MULTISPECIES: DUF2017 domain-containing protein [Rothia]ORC22250.1 hypothetical protein A7979_01900 [Rothia nasimurium]
MAQPFMSTARGITARFTPEEVEVLTRLFEDVALALEPESSPDDDPLAALVGISENVDVPSDPAVARMLPVASDDPEVADEYRRFTDLTLRRAKIEHLTQAAMDIQGGTVRLDTAGAHSWAAALNDVRLTLGARLGIASAADADRVGEQTDWHSVETTEDYMALLYNFVTWLQDSLMQTLLEGIDD